MNTTTWLLAANRSRARLFEVPREGDELVEIADFAHPEGRMHRRDLVTDGPGRFYGKGERDQGHSAGTEDDWPAHETNKFAEQIRDYLDHARTQDRFSELWIVAAPAFLGVLREKLTKGVGREVALEIDKDITTEAPRDILASARREHARRDARRAQA
jgi:protein required for attachment to host cells